MNNYKYKHKVLNGKLIKYRSYYTVWKRIEEFPKYKISSSGDVKGKLGRIIKQKNGRVKLYRKDGRQTTRSVRKLYRKCFPEAKKDVQT